MKSRIRGSFFVFSICLLTALSSHAATGTRLTYSSGPSTSSVISPGFIAPSDGLYLVSGEASVNTPFGDALIGSDLRVNGLAIESAQYRSSTQGVLTYSQVVQLSAGDIVDVALIPGGIGGALEVFQGDINVVQFPNAAGVPSAIGTRLTYNSGPSNVPVTSPTFTAPAAGLYLLTGEASVNPPFGDALIASDLRVNGSPVETAQYRSSTQGLLSYSHVLELAAGDTVDVRLVPGGIGGALEVF